MFGIKYYPFYHAAAKPCLIGFPWINDPAGAVWDDDAKLYRSWAIFSSTYPINIFVSDWMEFTSPDGKHWSPGDVRLSKKDYNGGGLWGGSVIIDTNNTAGFGKNAAIYLVTAAMNESGNDLPYQSVSRWVAPRLGVNPKFIDYPLHNPDDASIDGGHDFRDPRVFWDDKHNRWVLAISVSYGIQFYSSQDTKTWQFLSVWIGPGRTYGEPGGVECPNLVYMPVDGGDGNSPSGKWVLFYSDQLSSRETVRAVVGEWDGTNFIPDSNDDVIDLDYGADFYAQSVYQHNGQCFMLGWLSNWKYAFVTPMHGYKNYLILPRKLSLCHQKGRYQIKSTPWLNEDQVFTTRGGYTASPTVIGANQHELPLRKVKTTKAFKLKLRLSVLTHWPSNINLNVRTNGKNYTQLFLLPRQGVAEVYRANSGVKPLVGFGQWAAPMRAPVDFSSGHIDLVAYVDSASVEYFLQNNSVVISAQTFPLDNALGVTLTASADGLCRVDELSIYPTRALTPLLASQGETS